MAGDRDASVTPAGPREIELKLAVAPDAMARLEALPWLHTRTEAPLRTLRLRSIYFDTADLDLARRQVTLRIRRQGRSRVQTLKSEAAPGSPVADRAEWQVAITGDEPDLAAFGDDRTTALLALAPTAMLRPLFETRIRRRVLRLRWPAPSGGDARIEVAFDHGEVVAAGRREPVDEVELELLDGPAEALLELAAALRGVVPLRLCGVAKAARGYRLAAGAPLRHRKAGKLRLAPGMTVDEAMRQVFRHCLAHALANEAAAAEGRNPDAVHQLRVALRRFRSALAVFAAALPPPQRARWTEEARWLLRALGGCRDLDVLLADLLPAAAGIGDEAAPRAGLQDLAAHCRGAAADAVAATLASQRAGDFFLDLALWTQRGGWHEPAAAETAEVLSRPIEIHAMAVLERRFRRLRKAGKGFAGLDAAGRHKVRIQAKKLRYGLEFFGGTLSRPAVKRHRRALTRLLERLGRRNDIATARRLIGELLREVADPVARAELAGAGGEVVGWHAHAAMTMEADTRRAWDAVKALDPRRLFGG